MRLEEGRGSLLSQQLHPKLWNGVHYCLQCCMSRQEQLHFWVTAIQAAWPFVKSFESGPGSDFFVIFFPVKAVLYC